jgi:hypothetical protein
MPLPLPPFLASPEWAKTLAVAAILQQSSATTAAAASTVAAVIVQLQPPREILPTAAFEEAVKV